MKQSKSKTILIVENDNVVRRSVARLVELDGWHVLEASNGVQGLRVFRNEAPDVVLTDVVMGGLDGFSLTAVIKSIRPHAPVIVMTGLINPELDAKAQELGVSAFLRKPFEPELLLFALSRSLASSDGERRS
jgi:CheY-like chemotaxis protein